MSFKRIAIVGAVAVGAMALVGGGYAAAQDNGPSTTLITTPTSSGSTGRARSAESRTDVTCDCADSWVRRLVSGVPFTSAH